MKPKLNALIVGAGGVASYMLPALNNSFDLHGFLVDGDKLEKHNLDRQIFSNRDIGKYKVDGLIKHHKIPNLKGLATYVDSGFELDLKYYHKNFNPDVIITLVDNHPARSVCCQMAEYFQCGLIIAANEYSTSQAMYWHPRLGDNLLPSVRYPEIETVISGSPINCTGDALASDPQLAIANSVSASLANYLIWLWYGNKGSYELQDLKGFEVIEYQSTISKIQTITLDDTRKK